MYTLDSLGLNYGIGGYTVRIQRPEAKSRFRSPYIFPLLEASHRNKIFFTTKIALLMCPHSRPKYSATFLWSYNFSFRYYSTIQKSKEYEKNGRSETSGEVRKMNV
ncbi:hypothetical protein OUZ56_007571 [Daphnia magna]|uniref:Uncharacterized protein n=1 Tax=Daphnia magna TaxID=35525 RepID=A0ABR0AAC2_9CRUS|nr:hypothetical protein OUZ56_007571 [Daphnia magna]